MLENLRAMDGGKVFLWGLESCVGADGPCGSGIVRVGVGCFMLLEMGGLLTAWRKGGWRW